MGKAMTVEKVRPSRRCRAVLTILQARRGRARTPTPGRYYGPPKRNDRESVLTYIGFTVIIDS
jgi:hypothetical protein